MWRGASAAKLRRLESGIGRDRRQPCLPPCAGIERDPPSVWPIAERQGDFEAALGQQRAEPLGPFDQRDARAERILDAELPGFLRGKQPIEVEMPYGRRITLVDLEEREGRARDLFFGIAARANEGARKGGLACAEISLEADDVCGLRQCRDPGC